MYSPTVTSKRRYENKKVSFQMIKEEEETHY
jgi:hypothetical protein